MITLDELNAGMIGRCGLKSQGEVELLWQTVQRWPGLHVEIGTLWGGSAIVAGLAKKEAMCGEVITIDPMRGGWWDTGDPVIGRKPTPGDVLDNLVRFGVEDVVQVMRVRSEPWPLEGYVETVLIDGDHSFEGCLRDWDLVRERTGMVLFHDYDDLHPGVRRVVDEVVRRDKGWSEEARQGCLVGFWDGVS